jgi:hypothetical protein
LILKLYWYKKKVDCRNKNNNFIIPTMIWKT